MKIGNPQSSFARHVFHLGRKTADTKSTLTNLGQSAKDSVKLNTASKSNFDKIENASNHDQTVRELVAKTNQLYSEIQGIVKEGLNTSRAEIVKLSAEFQNKLESLKKIVDAGLASQQNSYSRSVNDFFLQKADFITNAEAAMQKKFTPATGDLNGDNIVDGADLGMVLGAYGEKQSDLKIAADLDNDGIIGEGDMKILLNNWGKVGQTDTIVNFGQVANLFGGVIAKA